MHNPARLLTAVAATLAAEGASATTTPLYLTAVLEHVKGAYSYGNINSSTATWSYDDETGLLSQTGGVFNVRFTITSSTTLFRHTVTGLVAGNMGAASATAFTCTEGNFGANVGASICGNYTFGANFANESTLSWGPGMASSRTLGGDDMALGAVRGVSMYDTFRNIRWDGQMLIVGNAACNPSAPGNANNCSFGPTPATYPYGYNTGYSFVLQTAVPVPAAAWLLGGALLALGAARRRA